MEGKPLRSTLILLILLTFWLLPFPFLIPESKATSGYSYYYLDSPLQLEPHVYPEGIYNGTVNTSFFVYYKNNDVNDEIYVKSYNHTTETMSASVLLGTISVDADVHKAPTIGWLSNGSLITFYGSHHSSQLYRVSNGAWNIDSWFSEQTRATDAYTYPQIVSYSDTAELFIRKSVGTYDVEWYRYTFTPASLWADETKIFEDSSATRDEGGLYAVFRKETDDSILMSASLFNETKSSSCREGWYYARSTDKGATWAKADGTSLSLPISPLSALAVNNTSTVSWFDGGYPFISGDNQPHMMGIGGYQGADVVNPEGTEWNAPVEGIWDGSSWSADYIRNQDNLILNTTGWYADPSGYSICPFRDADFNRTAFWFNSAPFNTTGLNTGWVCRYIQSVETRIFIKTVQTDLPTIYSMGMAIENHADPYEAYLYVNGGVEYGYLMKNLATDLYTFKGKYHEETGLIYDASERAVNVTAHFSDGTDNETFEVNGTYYYGASTAIRSFSWNGTTIEREYWVSNVEGNNDPTIYLFDADADLYTIKFNDRAGVLKTYSYVVFQRYINGSLMTIEKRKVDEERKVIAYLIYGDRYTLSLWDTDETYVFGDVEFATESTVTLNINAIDFPKSITEIHKYIQIYAYREHGSDGTGNITVYYNDVLEQTVHVYLEFQCLNGTVRQTYNATSNLFSYTWTSAYNTTSYYVVADIHHSELGEVDWQQYLMRESGTSPFSLSFMGTLPFDSAIILPALIIIFFFGAFSTVNSYMGIFFGTLVAIILTILGWIPIPASALVVVMMLAIVGALSYFRRTSR